MTKTGLSPTVAIIQMIAEHNQMIPRHLVNAIALLEKNKISYTLYDIEQTEGIDFDHSLENIFPRIKEKTIFVSLSCHNSYIKIGNLVFIYLYLHRFKNKNIIICSPYLSFYDLKPLVHPSITFNFNEIDEVIQRFFNLKSLGWDEKGLWWFHILKKHHFINREFWSYLTFGCFHDCDFCFNKKIHKKDPPLIYNTHEEVLCLMRFAESVGSPKFKFIDPNFLADKRYTNSFLKRYKKEGYHLSWRCKTRLDHMDENQYKLLLAAGCKKIFFGMEHVSQNVLKMIRKNQNSKLRLFEFLSFWNNAIDIELSFLVGLKHETKNDIQENFALMKRLSALKRVRSYLGYTFLFNEKKRIGANRNYLIPFLALFHIIPKNKTFSRKFISDVLSLIKKNNFFDFFYLTESRDSLIIFKELASFYLANPHLRYSMPEFNRFMEYENGNSLELLLSTQTLTKLNRAILTYLQ